MDPGYKIIQLIASRNITNNTSYINRCNSIEKEYYIINFVIYSIYKLDRDAAYITKIYNAIKGITNTNKRIVLLNDIMILKWCRALHMNDALLDHLYPSGEYVDLIMNIDDASDYYICSNAEHKYIYEHPYIVSNNILNIKSF